MSFYSIYLVRFANKSVMVLHIVNDLIMTYNIDKYAKIS